MEIEDKDGRITQLLHEIRVALRNEKETDHRILVMALSRMYISLTVDPDDPGPTLEDWHQVCAEKGWKVEYGPGTPNPKLRELFKDFLPQDDTVTTR